MTDQNLRRITCSHGCACGEVIGTVQQQGGWFSASAPDGVVVPRENNRRNGDLHPYRWHATGALYDHHIHGGTR